MRQPHDFARALLADPIVCVFLGTVAAAALSLLSPILSPDQRQFFSDNLLDPLCLFWAVAACFAGLQSIPNRAERIFWRYFGVGLGGWLVAISLFGLVPEERWNRWWQFAAHMAMVVYYVAAVLALERQPHRGQVRSGSAAERWLPAAGVGLLSLAWMVYALLVPDLVATARPGQQARIWASYLAFDGTLSAGLTIFAAICRDRRWRVLYGGLAIALLLSTGIDVLDALMTLELVHWEPPVSALLLWTLPFLALVVTIRLRHLPLVDLPVDSPADSTTDTGLDSEPSSVWLAAFLVLGAFSLPAAHLLLRAFRLVPSGFDSVEHLVAALSMVSMGVLAIAAFRLTERRRRALQAEQRQLELRYLQSQKMEAVGRLAGGIAHDFNNLLTVMSGFADLALDEVPPGHDAALALGEVKSAAGRATDLTRQLLALGRRQLLAPEPVRVNQVVERLLPALRQLTGPAITLRTRLDPGVCWALADTGQLEQVLLNLVVNARDAMPAGGPIVISTVNVDLDPETQAGLGDWPDLPPGPGIRIDVADVGVGIPADVLPRIFEPFYSTKASGTGLGLATSYGILRQSRGAITVSSKVGRGSTFSIYLPQTVPSTPATKDTSVASSRGGSETVLLAEDEPAVRDLARTVLARAGYSVLAAASGEEALQVGAGHAGRIDLLVTDVIMPGMNGRALAERLLAERPGIRVLYMTGYTDDAVVRHGVLDAAVALLQKPFSQEALIARVRQVLDAPVPDRSPRRPGTPAEDGR